MNVVFEITGLSCDLALHPVSHQTVEMIRQEGPEIYGEKYVNWWRRGNTRSFGMRINEQTQISLEVDGKQTDFNVTLLYRDVYTMRSRMYLDTKAQYLAVLGQDNERCTFRWTWNDVADFDPAAFKFVMTDWDDVLGTRGYRVLDTVFYGKRHADKEEWINPGGFTPREPLIINLDDVRRRIEAELSGTAHYAS